ncbi:hypothetical protein D3C73_1378370 [compost metagenome]
MLTAFDFLIQQAECHGKTINGGGRRRGAAGDIDINRYDAIGAAPYAVEIVENAAAVAAGTVRDADFRIGRSLPGADRRDAHGAGDRPGKQQNIGMTG